MVRSSLLRSFFERLMDNWKTILEPAPDLETIVPGHSDVPLTVDGFREMYEYLSRLWADVQAAREKGTSLVRFLMRNVFKERYPEVAEYNWVRPRLQLAPAQHLHALAAGGSLSDTRELAQGWCTQRTQ